MSCQGVQIDLRIQLHNLLKYVICFLTGLFGKAKKKILGEKDEVDDGGLQSSVYKSPAVTVSGYDPAMWEPQEIGLLNNTANFCVHMFYSQSGL